MKFNRFGARLKKLRELQGLSVDQLASMVKLSRTSIIKFEDDEIRPKWKTLQKLSVVLKTSEVFILTGKSIQKSKVSDRVEHRYRLIRMLIKEPVYLSRFEKLLDTFISTAIRTK